ncbi:MAG TPA: VCBS repeat-containing protein, partial [Chryseosolibacter sp.]
MSDESGISFKNTITYSDTLTVLDFEYLYNGGGVGIGDINNDGLQDLYFTGNMTSGRLFLNKGNLRFEDITEKAGVSTSVWVNGVSMVDINQDGHKDIFLCVAGTRNTPAAKKKNLLFINNGNQTFTESAATYGLQGSDHNIQSAFFDYDRDGDLDLYLLRNAFVEYSRNRARPKSVNGESATTHQLYRNNGNNTFTNVSAEAGILIEGFGLGVQVCDINNDHWPDIFVSNDFITNDLMYMNNGDGTFTNRAAQYLKHQTYNAMGNDVADINNDGLVDIVEVDMLPPDNSRWKVTIMGNNYDEFQNTLAYGYEPQYVRNTLQLNNGNGSFSEIGYMAGIEATDWSWAPLLADFDNDCLKDLFITNGYRQDITNLDFIKFSDLAARMGTQEGNKKERMNMLNNIPGIKVHNYIYKNNGDLTFSDKSARWGLSEPSYSNGAAYADLDNDGDLDLVINNIDAEVTLLINAASRVDGKRKKHFIRFGFSGAPLNREGFGAKVYVRHNGHIQYQFFTPFRGFLSTVEPFLHFGMDTIERIDSVEIIWPDGRFQLLQNVKTDQTIQLEYSESALPFFRENKRDQTLLFEKISVDAGLDFTHHENDFVDFKVQPLLPHMHSRNGPGLAVGDINGDALEDVYIGSAMGGTGGLFLQQPGSKFKRTNIPNMDSLSDDMGVLFFDADNDQDLDLYVVSGGTEHAKGPIL